MGEAEAWERTEKYSSKVHPTQRTGVGKVIKERKQRRLPTHVQKGVERIRSSGRKLNPALTTQTDERIRRPERRGFTSFRTVPHKWKKSTARVADPKSLGSNRCFMVRGGHQGSKEGIFSKDRLRARPGLSEKEL